MGAYTNWIWSKALWAYVVYQARQSIRPLFIQNTSPKVPVGCEAWYLYSAGPGYKHSAASRY